MTFFKQVKRTLNFKLEIRVSQEPRAGAQDNLFPRVLLGTSRRGACERGWAEGWKALRMGGRTEMK